ncbi:MAG: hotdog fold thioesterase [Ottowia sp.]|nr:hotdog fold thioesterase [Ottowia sp.]
MSIQVCDQSEVRPIWFQAFSLAQLVPVCEGTAISHLGIELSEVGPDFLRARMPVDARTAQPFGLLHGGASVLLAETLGSLAAELCVDSQKFRCVGLEINANHVRGVRSGWVTGTTKPIHIGRSTQIWETRIVDEQARLVCLSRLTVGVLDLAKDSQDR